MQHKFTLGLVFASTLATAVSAENVHIAYGAYSSPTSTLVGQGIIPFIDEAERLSDGSLTFELLSGGAVVGTQTSLSGMRDGLVDGALISSINYPSELPQQNITSNLAPGIAADTRAVAAATTEMSVLKCPRCREELEKWNVKYLGGYGVSSYSLLCSEPVSKLDDLQGLRVRATGNFGTLATALGMVPVNMTITETYEALQRGQVDCTLGSPGWLTTFSMGDVANNVLLMGMGTAFAGPLLNVSLDKWDVLDDAQKDALKRAAAHGTISSAAAYEAADDVVLANAEASGYTVVEAGSDIRAVLDQFSADTRDAVVAQAEERGLPDAAETVDTFLELLDKWKAIVSEAGDNNEAISERLYNDVLVKID